MKDGKLVKILKPLSLILAAVVVGFYIFDVTYNKTPPTENLFRTVAVACMLIGSFLRFKTERVPKGLGAYEKAYANELGTAFADRPSLRRKLVGATRLYNEGKYVEALDQLDKLVLETEGDDDLVPVLLFSALCFTDLNMDERAIEIYEELISYQPDNARFHSNVGMAYGRLGDNVMAISHYDRAIECDPTNYYAYNNRAHCHFEEQDNESAIADAKKALEIKNNGVEAATLLAIIYDQQGDKENKARYFRTAVTSGRSAKDLDRIIEFYNGGDKGDDAKEEL